MPPGGGSSANVKEKDEVERKRKKVRHSLAWFSLLGNPQNGARCLS